MAILNRRVGGDTGTQQGYHSFEIHLYKLYKANFYIQVIFIIHIYTPNIVYLSKYNCIKMLVNYILYKFFNMYEEW